MRNIEADGSITDDCRVCQGSGNKGSQRRDEPCEGTGCSNGRVTVAPAGAKVTNESPVVKKFDNYGDGLPSIVQPPSVEEPDAAIVDSVDPASSAVAIEEASPEPIQEMETAE